MAPCFNGATLKKSLNVQNTTFKLTYIGEEKRFWDKKWFEF